VAWLFRTATGKQLNTCGWPRHGVFT